MLQEDDPLKSLGHGAAGAEWLRQRGYDELAPAVASHPVMEIGTAASYQAWADKAGMVGRVVTYADKRARQDVRHIDGPIRAGGTNATRTAQGSTRRMRGHSSSSPKSVASRVSSRRTLRACAGSQEQCVPRPDLAYFWGEDAWSIERAGRDFRATLEQQAGQPYEIWRTSGEEDDASAEATAGKRRDRVIDGIAEHLAISPMFSAGTLVVVRQPASLLREAAARERVIRLATEVAPGNALLFLDLLAAGASGPAQQGTLRDAIEAAGGTVKGYPALSRERMEGWIDESGHGAGHNAGTRCEPAARRTRRRLCARRRCRPPPHERAGQRRAGEAGALSARTARSRERTSTRSLPKRCQVRRGRSWMRSAAAARRKRRQSLTGCSTKAHRSRS